MKKLLLLLAALTTIFAASPTGPGTFVLKRTTYGAPVDLMYFDSVWHVGAGLRRSGDTISLNYSGVLPGTYGDATHVPQVTVDSFGRITNVSNVTISGSGGGGGTVTSVGLALPASVFTVSGSPIVGSGTLTGSFANQSANTAFMAPNGSAGTPTFRAFLPGDISFLTDSITVTRTYALARVHDTSLALRTLISAREMALGVPSQSGQVLSSTTPGVRSWISVVDSARVRAIIHDTSLVLRQRIADSTAAARTYTLVRISDSLRVERTFDTTTARIVARDTAIKIRTQIHDTADTLRKYTRDRIHDTSLTLRTLIAAREPALGNPSQSGQVLSSTTGGVRSWISTIDSAKVRSILHDTALVLRQRIADTSAALRLALTDPAEVRVIVHDTSLSIRAAIPAGGPFLPLAAGSGSPLTGDLYGTRAVLTTTADAPITISQNLAGGFTHPFQAFNSGMVAGNQYNFDFGQSASTNNAANFGFKYVGAGSSSNYATLGMYGANDLLTVSGKAEARLAGSGPSLTFRNLSAGTNEKVWAWSNAGSALTLYAYDDAESVGSGAISISRTGATATNLLINPAQVDITALSASGIVKAATGTGRLGIAAAPDFPTLNQNTTGNAATATKWATARTLTIGSSAQTIDGTSDKTFSLAAIGAQAAGTYLTPSNVSGTAGQVAIFTGINTVASGNRLLYASSFLTVGNGTDANYTGININAPAGQYRAINFQDGGVTRWEQSSTNAAGWRLRAYDASGVAIDDPFAVTNASGGTIALGGGGRPIVATAGSYFDVTNAGSLRRRSDNNGGAIFPSGVTPGAATYAVQWRADGAYTTLNATTAVEAKIGNSPVLSIGSAGHNLLAGGYQINGTDAITSARAFRGAAESQFSNGTYTDPHPTFAHDAKFGQNGIATASLYVNGTSTLGALTGATTRLATINAAGQIGATSWANDGPWLPLTGGTVSGLVNFNADIVTGRILTGVYNDFLVSFGAVLLRTGDGTSWSAARVQFPSTATANSFRVDGGAQFNGDVSFTSGVTVGPAKQVPSVLYSTSNIFPILTPNTWCWVIHDSGPGGPNYWTVPTGMTVQYYAGGTTITSVTAGNTVTVVANQKAWMLYGPTYSGAPVMTLRM